MREDKALAAQFGIPKWARRYAVRYGSGVDAMVRMDLQMNPRPPKPEQVPEYVAPVVVDTPAPAPLRWWERLDNVFKKGVSYVQAITRRYNRS